MLKINSYLRYKKFGSKKLHYLAENMLIYLCCLCRWVQAECKKLGDNDNPEVSNLLKMAVCCLKERPVLFKYCAEEV